MLQKRNKIVKELATTLKKLTARAIFSLLPKANKEKNLPNNNKMELLVGEELQVYLILL